jgi:hypothetical protein
VVTSVTGIRLPITVGKRGAATVSGRVHLTLCQIIPFSRYRKNGGGFYGAVSRTCR